MHASSLKIARCYLYTIINNRGWHGCMLTWSFPGISRVGIRVRSLCDQRYKSWSRTNWVSRLPVGEDRYQTVVHAVVYRLTVMVNVCLRYRPPFISECAEEKRTEQNSLYASVTLNSEAEVTNNRRLRSTYCTIEANYWQTRSIARPFCETACNSRASCWLT